MSLLYLCHEVHTGILHLTAAVCLWWHPHIALGLFQWSHTQACHISLVNACDFSALLQPHSSSRNRGVKPQPAARSNWQLQCLLEGTSSEGSGRPWHGSSHSLMLAEQMRVLRSSPGVTGRRREEPVKCRVKEEMRLGIMGVDSLCSPCSNQSPADLESPEGTLNLSKNEAI